MSGLGISLCVTVLELILKTVGAPGRKSPDQSLLGKITL